MFADVLAGLPFDDGIDQRRRGSDRTAVKGTAEDPGCRRQLVTGETAVQGGDDGDMLKGVDDVEEIEEVETVFPEECLRELLLLAFAFLGRTLGPGRGVVEGGAAEDGVGVVDV